MSFVNGSCVGVLHPARCRRKNNLLVTSSEFQPYICQSVAQDAIVSAGGPAKQPFLAALNVTEVEMRSKYSERFPAQAWQLNQNPAKGHGMRSTDLWLHTLIHNLGLILIGVKIAVFSVQNIVLSKLPS